MREDISHYPAINPEGKGYDWWMVDRRHPEDVVYADSYHDMVLVLSRRSRDGSPEENMNALITAGLNAVVSLKRQLEDIIRSEPAMVPLWEAEIIIASLQHKKDVIYGWGDGNNDFIIEDLPTMKFAMRDIWNSQVPLILFELHYAPYTHLQPPLSGYGEGIHPPNIKWVRISSDFAFIDSLQVAGLIDFGRTFE